jgi:hypothetical protein
MDKLNLFIDEKQRLPLLQQQVQLIMGDAAIMPLYWEPRPVLALKSVRADVHPSRSGWNAFTWDKDE